MFFPKSFLLLVILAPLLGFGQAYDLTGLWQDDVGGQYRIRQVESTIGWFDDRGPTVMNVFMGTITGNRISGRWLDLPGGQLQGSGSISLRIDSNDRITKLDSDVLYGGSVLTRAGSGPGTDGSYLAGDWPGYWPDKPNELYPERISQSGGRLTVEAGVRPGDASNLRSAAAYMDGSGTIVVSDWGVRGTVKDRNRIEWSNGSVWFRGVTAAPPSGPSVAGNWTGYWPDKPNELYPERITQSGDGLTSQASVQPGDASNMKTSSGHIEGSSVIVATDWGMRGTITDNGNRINWSNNSVWVRPGSGPTTGRSICDDPRTLAVMDDWLNRALPPQNPGDSLRYEPWGRIVGTTRSTTLRVSGPPDTNLTRCQWLWMQSPNLQSANGLGTLRDYVQQSVR